MEKVDRYRTMGVRANADTADDARLALSYGADGIGLYRTEHMFYGSNSDEPLFLLRKMILSTSGRERRNALAGRRQLREIRCDGLLFFRRVVLEDRRHRRVGVAALATEDEVELAQSLAYRAWPRATSSGGPCPILPATGSDCR